MYKKVFFSKPLELFLLFKQAWSRKKEHLLHKKMNITKSPITKNKWQVITQLQSITIDLKIILLVIYNKIKKISKKYSSKCKTSKLEWIFSKCPRQLRFFSEEYLCEDQLGWYSSKVTGWWCSIWLCRMDIIAGSKCVDEWIKALVRRSRVQAHRGEHICQRNKRVHASREETIYHFILW